MSDERKNEVEAKARELHAIKQFVGKSTWNGGGTHRSYWRNQAKIALGLKPNPREMK